MHAYFAYLNFFVFFAFHSFSGTLLQYTILFVAEGATASQQADFVAAVKQLQPHWYVLSSK